MEQRLSMITLGVADLKRAVAFYENVIGWNARLSERPLAQSMACVIHPTQVGMLASSFV